MLARFIFIIIAVTISLAAPLSAETLKAQIAVEHNEVYVGEPFLLQIQVAGSENPEKPDMSQIDDFTITQKGGQSNSSRSMQIINGQVTQKVRHGFIYNYLFSAKRTGRFIIPPITVHAGAQSAITDSITIDVKKPVETNDFKLRLELSNRTPYVGEPLKLTYTLYLKKNIRSLQFNIPFLEQTDSFYFADPKRDVQSNKELYEIAYQSGKIVTEKGREELNGETYTTLQFTKIIIPQKAGRFQIETATASCEALMGYRQPQHRSRQDFFSDFFNNNTFGRQEIYKSITVPANSMVITVSDVPLKNRPKNFAGHVGHYQIKAEAAPKNVSVGDPITLTLTLSGPEYLEHIKLPPLKEQSDLVKDFKIPSEPAVGETTGQKKIFTQTIRALRPDVKSIPSISLVYFDTELGTYQTAKTAPIPLNVKAAKIVTAMDAEGRLDKTASGSRVETWESGIAYNYDDLSVIEKHHLGLIEWFQSSTWLLSVALPPLLFFSVLCLSAINRRRNSDPWTVAARKAYSQFKRNMNKAQTELSAAQSSAAILDGLRNYLSAKLHLPGGVITINDIEGPLSGRDVHPEDITRLKQLIQQCEAGRYAGTISDATAASLVKEAIELSKQLEQQLK